MSDLPSNQLSGRIPVPSARRASWMRRRVGPVAIWSAALLGCVILAGRAGQPGMVVGIVRGDEATVLPLRDGRVIDLPVALYEDVRPGDVIAVMDDAEIRAELEVLRTEGRQLRAALGAEGARLEALGRETQTDALTAARRFAIDLEERRLDVLDRHAALEAKRVEEKRLTHFRETLATVLREGGVGQLSFDETELRLEVVRAEIEHETPALEEAERLLAAARERAEAQGGRNQTADDDALLAPFRRQVEVLEARMRLAELGATSLILRSPIRGKVVAVMGHPGDLVQAGTPLVRLADSAAATLVAYLPEDANLDVEPGAEVVVTARDTRRSASGVALRVGPAFEEMPPRLQTPSAPPRHARPVLIAFSGDHTFQPGEVVAVSF